MQAADPYAVLGVAPDASQAQIASAFRRLVRSRHPDLHEGPMSDHTDPGSASADLGRIVTAYAVLRDPDRRAEHDRSQRRLLPDLLPPPSDAGRTPRRAAAARQPPITAGPVIWRPAR